ncbi:type VI secretion system contractile sheath small subunit [Yersinia sp. 2466 StPb PI]|uniref:type VI secretion system contractile sheath small subunit n=1 Tax=Yersinia sp. 2466 StPb PI TaxID=3061648 RepID=UPI00355B42EA
MSNTQKKLGKIRAPRVQITYDVENCGAESKKELPLVLGVVGDFSQQDVPLRDRNFLHIDKDNFNDVMDGMSPSIELLVDSAIPGKNGQLAVYLQFNSMEDFSPENVAMQVEPLKNLLALREKLTELRNRIASNDALKEQLVELLSQQGNVNLIVDGPQGDLK